jgi:predicted peptidase
VHIRFLTLIVSILFFPTLTLFADDPVPEAPAAKAETPEEKAQREREEKIRLQFAVRDPIPGKQVARMTTVKWISKLGEPKEKDIHYLLFLPSNYEEKTEPWPLLLFLHGDGQRGYGGKDLGKLYNGGPTLVTGTRRDFPFIMVSPQSPPEGKLSPIEVMALVDRIGSTLRVDQSRIYVTGLSGGGITTWILVGMYPDRIAAAIPIASKIYTPDLIPKLAKTPFWVFQGETDGSEHITQVVNEIKEAGNKQIELVVYPGVGHNAWTQTYSNPKIYDWLLTHRLPEQPEK